MFIMHAKEEGIMFVDMEDVIMQVIIVEFKVF